MTKNFDKLLTNCLNEMQTPAGGAQPNLVEVIKAALNSTKVDNNDKFANELKALVDKHAPAQQQQQQGQQNNANKPGQPNNQNQQQNTTPKPGQPNNPNQQQNQQNK